MTARLGRSLRSQREFVANASHQLRTPLTGLRLRLEAAAAKSDDPQVRDELAAAEHETERLARLLAELLTLAGERERPEPQPVDVGDAAGGAFERWRRPARRSGHELIVDEGEPTEVCASPEDVAAMLDNLIENALRYSPAGGRVTIGWRSDGRRVRIGVDDEGPGIEADESERVFERFYRGSASGGQDGTGLGLNVVEALAKRWDGEASLTNRPEGGARAEIVLPAHSSLPAADQEPYRGGARVENDEETFRARRRTRDRRPRGRGGHRPAREHDLGRQRRAVGPAAERRRHARAAGVRAAPRGARGARRAQGRRAQGGGTPP